MDTTSKPLRGMAIVRKLIEVKESEQKAAQEAFHTNPKIRAIYENLKRENAGKRPGK